MRKLVASSAVRPAELFERIAAALGGDGPAVLPVPEETQPESIGEVPNNVALVIETSGSTGVPKHVMLSTNALTHSANATAEALYPDSSPRWILALPGHYIAGAQVLIRSYLSSSRPLALPPGPFDPRVFARIVLETEGHTITSFVPAQLARLVESAADPDVLSACHKLTAILVGGQALTPKLRARAENLGLPLHTTYGATETSGGCIYDGKPIGDLRMRTNNGLIELAGSCLAEGYWRDLERTSRSFHRDEETRWYRTNDLGHISDGVLTVDGRADNVIISGGVKISLNALEHTIHALDPNAIVLGMADDKWGQTPVVILPESSGTSLDAIRAHVTATLGRAAAPSKLIHVHDIPMLASGKPNRPALQILVESQRQNPTTDRT